jgi:hypothetical protein
MWTMNIKHYNTVEDTLKYLKENPTFISGFVSGEGCFTAYLGIDTTLTWGLSPNCEFSITQNSGDLILLEAFNQYFNTKGGGVYDKKDGVSVFMVRNLIEINNIIIPFFIKNPLVGTKSFEFEKFIQLVKLIMLKKHIGKEISNRDIFIKMALICKELNFKMENNKKLTRIDFIINWLRNLKNFPPSLEEKLNLKNELKIKLQELKNT